jgi:hypothetical protein
MILAALALVAGLSVSVAVTTADAPVAASESFDVSNVSVDKTIRSAARDMAMTQGRQRAWAILSNRFLDAGLTETAPELSDDGLLHLIGNVEVRDESAGSGVTCADLHFNPQAVRRVLRPRMLPAVVADAEPSSTNPALALDLPVVSTHISPRRTTLSCNAGNCLPRARMSHSISGRLGACAWQAGVVEADGEIRAGGIITAWGATYPHLQGPFEDLRDAMMRQSLAMSGWHGAYSIEYRFGKLPAFH